MRRERQAFRQQLKTDGFIHETRGSKLRTLLLLPIEQKSDQFQAFTGRDRVPERFPEGWVPRQKYTRVEARRESGLPKETTLDPHEEKQYHSLKE